VSLAFLVDEEFFTSLNKNTQLSVQAIKIKVTQHKHTLHSNIIQSRKTIWQTLYGTKVWHEVWLARYDLIDWKGHVL
jgi:hypothetical protein